MPWLDSPPLDCVTRRREQGYDPVDDRRLARRLADGSTVRVGPGAFATASDWEALLPIQRHAQRVWEAAYRVSPGAVFSHCAAAAVHGIDQLGSWPSVVDISLATSSGGRSSGIIRRRTRDLRRVQVMPWGQHYITTPAQTAVDIAAVSPFLAGVVAADQVLWDRRPTGALGNREHLLEVATAYSRRGSKRASRVAEFARSGADSVRESQSRVLISTLGFPVPQLQHRFNLPSGRVFYSDFWWPAYGLAGEFDGIGKYEDPALLRGRTPKQALIAEKDREDELRRVVRTVSRWRTPDLEAPRRLYDILTHAGLVPTSLRPHR